MTRAVPSARLCPSWAQTEGRRAQRIRFGFSSRSSDPRVARCVAVRLHRFVPALDAGSPCDLCSASRRSRAARRRGRARCDASDRWLHGRLLSRAEERRRRLAAQSARDGVRDRRASLRDRWRRQPRRDARGLGLDQARAPRLCERRRVRLREPHARGPRPHRAVGLVLPHVGPFARLLAPTRRRDGRGRGRGAQERGARDAGARQFAARARRLGAQLQLRRVLRPSFRSRARARHRRRPSARHVAAHGVSPRSAVTPPRPVVVRLRGRDVRPVEAARPRASSVRERRARRDGLAPHEEPRRERRA